MENDKFLKRTADYLLETEGYDMKDVLVVFPNKRPLLFLKKYLLTGAQNVLWLPQMMSIDDFVQQVTGLTFEDPLRIYFYLYSIHKTMASGENNNPDEFFNWAPVLLHDFNDLDNALADPADLYSFLTDAKALDLWNPDGSQLTEIQNNYLNFFRQQKDYYVALRKILFQKKAGYQGMIYRYLAEHFDELLEKIPWRKFCFAGFNALTAAEQRILDNIKYNKEFEFITDADEFYMTPQQGKLPEAGIFLNTLFKKWNINDIKWKGNRLINGLKKIDTVSVSLSVGQAGYAGQIINDWLKKGVIPMEIAVVPADESLLMPLLNAIPVSHPVTGERIKYNVTLGYVLSQSPLFFFSERWLELLKLRNEDKSSRFFVPLLLQLLNSAFGTMISGDDFHKFEKMLTEGNQVMIPLDTLRQYATGAGLDERLTNLLFDHCMPAEFAGRFLNVFALAGKILAEKEDENPVDTLWKHQLYLVAEQMKYLEELVFPLKDEITWKTLQKLFPVLFNRSKISLRGEPLEGVQIMGLLETRSLDFSHLIILGMNEGILPAESFQDTLISMDIRRKYGLALPQQSIAVYAYHFFRLLQRVEEGVFLYNGEAGDLGGGEKSRFLLQIKDELVPANKNIEYRELTLESRVEDMNDGSNIVIEKDETVLQKLTDIAEYGLSPSAINSYVLCPLQFYFGKIAGISEEESLETVVQANTFGSVVHYVLNELYAPFKGKVIDTEQLKASLKEIDELLKKAFLKEYNTTDITGGQNHLIYQVAKVYVERFVKKDVAELNEQPRKIIALEEKFESTFVHNNRPVKIKGFIDRIDALPGESEVRIIDYKTGMVKPNDLKLKNVEQLYTDSNRSKALQVMIYTWLYQKRFPGNANLRPGIISLRSISHGFMEVFCPETESTVAKVKAAEEALNRILDDLFDTDLPFRQQPDEKKCEYCDFKGICNR